MNVDAWLSGEEGARVVEAAQEAALADRYAPGTVITQVTRDEWHSHITAALRAALSLTMTEPCPKCGGSGLGKPYDCAEHGSHTPSCAGSLGGNPDCKGGTVPGEPALLSALVERVKGFDLVHAGAAFLRGDEDDAKFYRLRSLEQEDET